MGNERDLNIAKNIMEIAARFLLLSLLCAVRTGFDYGPVLSRGGTTISYDDRALIINGTRRVLLSGAIHYPRSTPEMWPDLIAKAKDGGLDVIETYVFWNGHEPVQGQYNFDGRFDLVKFLRTVQEAGLLVFLRIGPYACAEWNFGGFPVWLRFIPGLKLFRTEDEPFKNEMKKFTSKIVDMMKESKLFAWQGGPIIMTQIENEYGNVMAPYGQQGLDYIQWAGAMAESLDISVPWVMCQQENAPLPIINTCNGFYCDSFEPNVTHNSPKMWTENWTGWYRRFGGQIPHRPVEDIAYAVARFFQKGGTFQNYYMYHGGTNFARTSGGPFITTTYDYDAPIDEYGNLRLPKWGHLKELHGAIKQCERALTSGQVQTVALQESVEATVYSEQSSGACAAFISNVNGTQDANIVFKGQPYKVPAWSVSILPDCKNVVYNTAKISTQTSLMGMKKTNLESLINPSQSLETKPFVNWTWYTESVGAFGNDNFSATGLLEQIRTTVDKSDYLWYTFGVQVDEDEPFLTNKSLQPVLHVESKGHALHAFVNGVFLGTDTATSNFTFEAPIALNAGQNIIALLSMTVGLQNYGSFFDTWEAGITAVWMQGFKNGTIDLSSKMWVYQIGLEGEKLEIYSDTGTTNVKWNSGINPPENSTLIWYKTEFNAPDGDNPVALDLSSMNKGQAWINGMSIGRYWATYKASENGCSSTCDYRGRYSSSKCISNCGQPSQTMYHVPRSWLSPTSNVLVLLEEIGGFPSGVSFGTTFVDTICGHVSQADPIPKLQLQCSLGQHISSIRFASFGNPKGLCRNFKQGHCHARNSYSIVTKACVTREKCSINVSEELFGNPCDNEIKTLAIEAICQY